MSDQQEDSIASVTTVESTPEPIAEPIEQLRAEMAQMRAIIEQQQSELRDLREQTGPRTASRAERRTSPRKRATGRRESRRALLKWGGAAAAAAAVTAVASQGAHAAPKATGNYAIMGEGNVAENTTYFGYDSSSIVENYFSVWDAGTGVYSPAGWTGAITGVVGPSPASGIYNGVVGYTNTFDGYGVIGEADTNAQRGVYGLATSSGNSSSVGVYGSAAAGYGVLGWSGTGVDIYASGTGRIQQYASGSGAPTSGSYSLGEQIRDGNGELWLCISGGIPGFWVRAAHAVYGYAGGAVSYLSKPIRLLDTRNIGDALNNGTGAPLTNKQPSPSYTLGVAGDFYSGVAVPGNAVGALGNVTVVASSGGPGYVTLVPSGAGFSGTSNINYTANQTIANNFTVGLGGGAIDIYVGGSPTHVIIDLFAVVA